MHTQRTGARRPRGSFQESNTKWNALIGGRAIKRKLPLKFITLQGCMITLISRLHTANKWTHYCMKGQTNIGIIRALCGGTDMKLPNLPDQCPSCNQVSRCSTHSRLVLHTPIRCTGMSPPTTNIIAQQTGPDWKSNRRTHPRVWSIENAMKNSMANINLSAVCSTHFAKGATWVIDGTCNWHRSYDAAPCGKASTYNSFCLRCIAATAMLHCFLIKICTAAMALITACKSTLKRCLCKS